MKETNKDFLFEYILRSMLIICYPIWFLFTLLECKRWDSFKEVILLPFIKWGNTSNLTNKKEEENAKR